MKLNTLIEILEKIKSRTTDPKLQVYVNEEFGKPGKDITSISSTSDGYVIINTTDHSKRSNMSLWFKRKPKIVKMQFGDKLEICVKTGGVKRYLQLTEINSDSYRGTTVIFTDRILDG